MAGWVGLVGWLIADALSTKWSNSPVQDRESSPDRTNVLTTMLHQQLLMLLMSSNRIKSVLNVAPASKAMQCCLMTAGALTWPATAASRTRALTQSDCRDARPPNNGLSSLRRLCSEKRQRHNQSIAYHRKMVQNINKMQGCNTQNTTVQKRNCFRE